eukprot:7309435-Prymnesium_polylepis.4
MQHSQRVTANASGSNGCTLCADGYYRAHSNLPAVACTSCDSLRGVHCSLNATINTLTLEYGFWRHSSNALELWPCKSEGSWSPCHGGANAGHDGDAYCAAGFRGPFCERALTRTRI